MVRHIPLALRKTSSFALPCALGVWALAAGSSRPARAQSPAAEAPHLQPPVVIEESRPPYPAEAQGARGDVAVTATITPAGDVSGVELTTGVAPALNRAALKAAMSWRFRPALRNGTPVPSRVQLLFHFEPPPVVATTGAPATAAAGPPAPSAAPPGAAAGMPSLPEGVPAPAPKPGEVSAIDVSVRGRRQEPKPGGLRPGDPGRPARAPRQPESVRHPAARARHLHRQRGRRRTRRPGLPARLRRRAGPGDRVHGQRRPHQRGRQHRRPRLRRHPLHHPGAGEEPAGHRGAVRPPSGRLRGSGERRLPAGCADRRLELSVELRLVQHGARLALWAPETNARAPSPRRSCSRATASA